MVDRRIVNSYPKVTATHPRPPWRIEWCASTPPDVSISAGIIPSSTFGFTAFSVTVLGGASVTAQLLINGYVIVEITTSRYERRTISAVCRGGYDYYQVAITSYSAGQSTGSVGGEIEL